MLLSPTSRDLTPTNWDDLGCKPCKPYNYGYIHTKQYINMNINMNININIININMNK